ncbi:ATP-binding protein [Litorivivens sp.]|uniref:ATP-binding protein n=1 Tax=Litorivivens sp. TaxID=2020868 RepID=UPI00356A0EB7
MTLRDHGSGVPEDMLHKIFLPFFRVDESRQRASGGHGLGLAISKRIVKSHNGRITASNAQPGLTVSITLPASLRVEPPREM